jgi:DNA-binding CsgD family transcriptional regulator
MRRRVRGAGLSRADVEAAGSEPLALEPGELRAAVVATPGEPGGPQGGSSAGRAAACAFWRQLVEGRWYVVDRFDDGGRRYFVTRQTAPGMRKARALSPRERAVAALAAQGQALKVISGALGIAPSTASGALASALRKLGLRGRAELAQLLGQAAAGRR